MFRQRCDTFTLCLSGTLKELKASVKCCLVNVVRSVQSRVGTVVLKMCFCVFLSFFEQVCVYMFFFTQRERVFFKKRRQGLKEISKKNKVNFQNLQHCIPKCPGQPRAMTRKEKENQHRHCRSPSLLLDGAAFFHSTCEWCCPLSARTAVFLLMCPPGVGVGVPSWRRATSRRKEKAGQPHPQEGGPNPTPRIGHLQTQERRSRKRNTNPKKEGQTQPQEKKRSKSNPPRKNATQHRHQEGSPTPTTKKKVNPPSLPPLGWYCFLPGFFFEKKTKNELKKYKESSKT